MDLLKIKYLFLCITVTPIGLNWEVEKIPITVFWLQVESIPIRNLK